MAVETSIVVQFSDGSSVSDDSFVTVELDPEHANNLDSNGNLKSSFLPSDEPVFLVHYDPTKYTCSTPVASSGSVTGVGTDKVREKEIEFSFTAEGEEDSLGFHNPAIIGSIVWWGNSCAVTISGTKATSGAGTFPCVGVGTFNVTFQKQYKIIPPAMTLASGETYKIIVLVTLSPITT